MAKWDHEDLRDKSPMLDKTKNFYGATIMPKAVGLVPTTPFPADIDKVVDPFHPNIEFSIEKVTAEAQKRAIPADYGIREIYASNPKKAINYRYSEGKNMKEFVDYVNSTYSAHYTSKNEIQALDVFEALGSLFTTSRDLAIKYLWRAGKKGTKDDLRKDLLKVMHYCLFMLHTIDKEKE